MATLPNTPESDDIEQPDTGRLADDASRWRILAIVVAMVLLSEVTTFQLTMVGSALQKITKTFSDVGADINWAVILPGIVGAATTPILGKLSDMWGKKRIFLLCGVFFLVGSLLDAITSNWWVFLIGRGLQAFTVAMTVITYGLVRDLLPRKHIPISLGVVASGVGFSAVLGPVVAGLLVDNFDWRAMFWFLAIYVVAAMAVMAVVVPESKLRVRQRIQPFGILALSAGTMLILIYVDKGQEWKWGHPATLAWLIGGLLLVAAFVLIEFRSSAPIMDVRLLLSPKVALTLLLMLFGVGVLAVMPTATGYMTQTPSPDGLKESVVQGVVAQAHQMTGVTLPASLVHVGLDPGYHYGSGFSLLAYALHIGITTGIVAMIVGPISGLLARRIGVRFHAIVACVITAVCAAGFALAIPHYSWQIFAILAGVFGIGFALFYTAGSVLIVDALPEEQQGIGSGMLGVTMGLGSAIGTAILAAFQAAHPLQAHIDVMGHSVTQPIPQVFADRAYVLTFWFMAALVLVALVIALVMRHGRKPSTAGIITA
ncbi:MFS transporter [Nocardia macrotermitis]|uniref:Multidrug resistance protein MdtL n=1 Tax=Nocardia macrotermitis TaxID=2585198 RepID=A0A7K0D9X7_9NOCA|nr:MFS transporter [Nocardia macrotermitis]MQY22576.1 Multidrug resistance protein MdtL [Nocardia macrotermitis]